MPCRGSVREARLQVKPRREGTVRDAARLIKLREAGAASSVNVGAHLVIGEHDALVVETVWPPPRLPEGGEVTAPLEAGVCVVRLALVPKEGSDGHLAHGMDHRVPEARRRPA